MLARIGEVCRIYSACTFQCALSVSKTCKSCTLFGCTSVCNMIICNSLLQCCVAAENFDRDCLGASEASQAAHAFGTQRSAAFASLRIAPAPMPLLAQFASFPRIALYPSPGVGLRNPGSSGGEAAGSYGSAFILLPMYLQFFPDLLPYICCKISSLCALGIHAPRSGYMNVADLPACRLPKVLILHMCQNGRQE